MFIGSMIFSRIKMVSDGYQWMEGGGLSVISYLFTSFVFVFILSFQHITT